MTIDIKDFYLNTPMARPEFMRLKLSDMPNDIIEHYALHTIATEDRYIYVRIQKEMYGLPQAGIIAQQLLDPFRVGLIFFLVVTAHRTRPVMGLRTPLVLGVIFVAAMLVGMLLHDRFLQGD